MTNLFSIKGRDLQRKLDFIVMATDSRTTIQTPGGLKIHREDYQKLFIRDGLMLCGTGNTNYISSIFSALDIIQNGSNPFMDMKDVADWVMDYTDPKITHLLDSEFPLKPLAENDILNFHIAGLGKNKELRLIHANTTGNRTYIQKGKDLDKRGLKEYPVFYDGSGAPYGIEYVSGTPDAPIALVNIEKALELAYGVSRHATKSFGVNNRMQVGFLATDDKMLYTDATRAPNRWSPKNKGNAGAAFSLPQERKYAA